MVRQLEFYRISVVEGCGLEQAGHALPKQLYEEVAQPEEEMMMVLSSFRFAVWLCSAST